MNNRIFDCMLQATNIYSGLCASRKKKASYASNERSSSAHIASTNKQRLIETAMRFKDSDVRFKMQRYICFNMDRISV